jgi:hypothetical protein
MARLDSIMLAPSHPVSERLSMPLTKQSTTKEDIVANNNSEGTARANLAGFDGECQSHGAALGVGRLRDR